MSRALPRRAPAAAALASALAVATIAPAADARELTFNWPVPGEVTVTVDKLKRGQSARYRYAVVTQPDPGTTDILVHGRNVDVLMLNGEPVTSPEMRAKVAPAVAVLSAAPRMRVSEAGEFKGFVGGFDAVFDEFAKMAESDPRVLQILESMRSSPRMQRQIEAKTASNWNMWVGTWVGLEIDTDERLEFDSEVPLFGHQLVQPTVIEHRGASTACPTCIALRLKGTLDGPEFKEAWGEMMRSVIVQANKGADVDGFLASIESVRREVTVDLATDPETLRPATLTYKMRIVLNVRGKGANEQLERTKYTFAWK